MVLIPEELKRYDPMPLRLWGVINTTEIIGLECVWDIFSERENDIIEIREKTAWLWGAISWFIFSLCMPLAGLIYFVGWIEEPILIKVLMSVMFLLAGSTGFALFLVLILYTHYQNREIWGTVRLRYHVFSGDIEFPHKEIMYRKHDYSNLVLGCVKGYDMTDVFKSTGTKNRDRKTTIQYFALPQMNDGSWIRHDFANNNPTRMNMERGTKRFAKCVDLFQQYMNCEVFIRDYSTMI